MSLKLKESHTVESLKASDITMANVPWHEEVIFSSFGGAL